MGYTTNNGIENFWPDDTDSVKYISFSTAFDELYNKIDEWWPDVNIRDIIISVEYIHTKCLTYDLYDSSDYTCFIVITNTSL